MKRARDHDELDFDGNDEFCRDSFRKEIDKRDEGSVQSRERPFSTEIFRLGSKRYRHDEDSLVGKDEF